MYDIAFRAEIKATSDDLDNNEKDTFVGHRQSLEHYGFLVHWILIVSEQTSSSAIITTSMSTKPKVFFNTEQDRTL